MNLTDFQVQLTYTTLNKEKFSFYVSFPETCSLDVDDCSLDISEENVVVLLKKDPPASSADLWERFYVGLNPNQTMVINNAIFTLMIMILL